MIISQVLVISFVAILVLMDLPLERSPGPVIHGPGAKVAILVLMDLPLERSLRCKISHKGDQLVSQSLF